MSGVDSLYLLVMGISAALSLAAQAWVSSTVNRYKRLAARSGLRGVDVAATILHAAGIRGVGIEAVDGFLTDHYDPRAKVLRLSPANFYGRSLAAAGIAAHEVGHALQDAAGYWPMRMRQALVPVASLGTNLGVAMVVIGLGLGALGLAKVGVAMFAGFVAFTLITLPVELDASSRAKRALERIGILTQRELNAVSRVLSAAAATYMAAAVTAMLQLAYFLLQLNRDREQTT